MSGLINVIKNIFSGIFGFIGGLFGGKKAIEGNAPKSKKGNGGYFLEFDDSKSPSAPSPAPTTSTPEAEPMTVATETIAEATNNSDAQPAKSTRKEKLAALAAGDKPATATPAAATAEAPPEAPATSTPTPAVTKAPVSETAFATKYLVPTNNGARRRPGANMSSYLDMARKMNAAS
jgi:hypothetical protein